MGLSHKNQNSSEQPVIRLLKEDDIQFLADQCFPWITIEETKKKWVKNLEAQQKGMQKSCMIEYQGKIAGYGSLIQNSQYTFFKAQNIPEINDVWIFEPYRKKGLGTYLITYLEKLAKKEGYNSIGIGVGLYKDYGPAQRLYYQLGYIPDGNGIAYEGKQAIAGEKYRLDDELILWLQKPLKEKADQL